MRVELEGELYEAMIKDGKAIALKILNKFSIRSIETLKTLTEDEIEKVSKSIKDTYGYDPVEMKIKEGGTDMESFFLGCHIATRISEWVPDENLGS